MLKKLFLVFFILSSLKLKAQNLSIDSFVSEWLGKPYRFGGKTKKGIDCSAFVQRFYKDVYNTTIPRTCYYIFNFNLLKKVELMDLKIGDILLFASKFSPSGWHTGIYIGNDKFIHSSNYKEGIKISCLWDSPYMKNLKGVRRL